MKTQEGADPPEFTIASENAAGRQTKNGPHTEDVAKARASEHGAVTHSAEEGCIGHFCPFGGVFDGGLADRDRNHVADDHHQRNFG